MMCQRKDFKGIDKPEKARWALAFGSDKIEHSVLAHVFYLHSIGHFGAAGFLRHCFAFCCWQTSYETWNFSEFFQQFGWIDDRTQVQAAAMPSCRAAGVWTWTPRTTKAKQRSTWLPCEQIESQGLGASIFHASKVTSWLRLHTLQYFIYHQGLVLFCLLIKVLCCHSCTSRLQSTPSRQPGQVRASRRRQQCFSLKWFPMFQLSSI